MENLVGFIITFHPFILMFIVAYSIYKHGLYSKLDFSRIKPEQKIAIINGYKKTRILDITIWIAWIFFFIFLTIVTTVPIFTVILTMALSVIEYLNLDYLNNFLKNLRMI